MASWLADPGLAPYQDLDREWKTILLAQGQDRLPKVDERGRALFFLAVYDVDEFRQVIRKTDLGPQAPERLRRDDDVALLRFGYHYFKKLFPGG